LFSDYRGYQFKDLLLEITFGLGDETVDEEQYTILFDVNRVALGVGK
jgi:hypothetical protein